VLYCAAFVYPPQGVKGQLILSFNRWHILAHSGTFNRWHIVAQIALPAIKEILLKSDRMERDDNPLVLWSLGTRLLLYFPGFFHLLIHVLCYH